MSAPQEQGAHTGRYLQLASAVRQRFQDYIQGDTTVTVNPFSKVYHCVIIRLRQLCEVIGEGKLAGGVEEHRDISGAVSVITSASEKKRFAIVECGSHSCLDCPENTVVHLQIDVLAPESVSEFSHLVSLSLGAPDGAGVNSSEPSDKGDRGVSGYCIGAPNGRNFR